MKNEVSVATSEESKDQKIEELLYEIKNPLMLFWTLSSIANYFSDLFQKED